MQSIASLNWSWRRHRKQIVTAAVAFAFITFIALTSFVGTPGAGATSHGTSGNGIEPEFYQQVGNLTCSDLAGPGQTWIELKMDSPIFQGQISDGNLTVDVTNLVDDKTFDWSSNIGVDAVFVKAGQAGDYLYRYDPPSESMGDTGLTSPGDGTSNMISHISFCYDLELEVSKTAETSLTRTYEWEITKSVTPSSWDLFDGDSGTSDYEVVVTKTGSTDSNWAVSGTITIDNPWVGVSATIDDVSDSISGFGAVAVDCGVALPHVLGPGGTLECAYSTPLPDGTSRVNTATVESSGDVSGGEGTADVDFATATVTEVNATVDVEDNFEGDVTALGTIGGSDTFNYSRQFFCDADEGTHNNTASIIGDGDVVLDDASASVTVNCYELSVSKDANTSLTRTYEWMIEKSVTPEVWHLFDGDSGTSNYEVIVTKTGSTDSDHAVSGTIVISNPAPIDAELTGVADLITPDDIVASVDCGGETTVPANGELECTYSADLPNADDRTNTATATQQNYDYASNGDATAAGTTDYSGEAAVDFSTAVVTEVNATVDVEDNFEGDVTALGTIGGSDTFNYSRQFFCDADEGTHNNTASIIGDGDVVLDDASASVTVNCYDLTVTKDAIVERYAVEYEWDITKGPDGVYYLFEGESVDHDYVIELIQGAIAAEDATIVGDITVSNAGNPIPAVINSLADVLSGTGVSDVGATVTCDGVPGAPFPITIPAGGELVCSYTAIVESSDYDLNTATATQQNFDYPAVGAPTKAGTTDYSGTFDIVFPEPTEVAEVNISDDNGTPGDPGDDRSFNSPYITGAIEGYTGTFVCPDRDTVEYIDGHYTDTVVNTVEIIETNDSDIATVTIHCRLPASAQVIKTTTAGPDDIGGVPLKFELVDPGNTVVATVFFGENGGDAVFNFEIETEGTWTVRETLPDGWKSNDASLECTFDVNFPEIGEGGPDAAGQTFVCEFDNTELSRVDVLKLTNGVPNENQTWTFAIYEGADGFGGTEVASDSTPPALLDFGSTNLDPAQTYTLCELGVPAGWSSFWQIDFEGDGVGDMIVTAYNPNADDEQPEDLGNRCVDFGANTTIPLALVPGETLHFVVDNQAPGGAPRTPGYWKNWNMCTGGNQQYTASDNGGWMEGFWLVEDVLNQSGSIQVGILEISGADGENGCQIAVDILDKREIGEAEEVGDGKKKASDPLHNLATHYLAYQLNAGAGACASDEAQDAAVAAQALLVQYNFNGETHTLPKKNNPDGQLANELAGILDAYNNGEHCGD